MAIIKLTDSEKYLFDRIEHGDDAVFQYAAKAVGVRDGVYQGSNLISSEVLRHIILGLPLVKAGFQEKPGQKTGRGISITGATIEGRLDVDSGMGAEGAPLCPLEFTDCLLDGGFSGAHAHFSRLGFRGCTFLDRAALDEEGRRLTTINLAGAEIERTLDIRRIEPETADGILCIHAPGLNLKRGLDLTGCILRAPEPEEIAPAVASAAVSEDAEEAPVFGEEELGALNLSLSTIGGDLVLGGGSFEGRAKMRGLRIAGDVWLRGATFSASEEAILMQGSRIDGYLMMDSWIARDGETEIRPFTCTGTITLNSIDVGLSLHLKGGVEGNIVAHDLRVREDVELEGEVEGQIDLRDATVGGNLNLAGLDIRTEDDDAAPDQQDPRNPGDPQDSPSPPGEGGVTLLDLSGATVGRSLIVGKSVRFKSPGKEERVVWALRAAGVVDLRGLTCGTLKDGVGTFWDEKTRIMLNRFVYGQTAEQEDGPERRKPSHRLLVDWIRSKVAETWWLPRPKEKLSIDAWEPWQRRRNWIYRHLQRSDADDITALRRGIAEKDYRPQPLEQAIRVARLEGREDFATHIEMVKHRIEWQHFNERIRWWLAALGILVAAAWLVREHGTWTDRILGGGGFAAVIAALAVTLGLMAFVSTVSEGLKRLGLGGRFRKVGVWIILFLPALLLLLHPPWSEQPFHFVVAFLIFIAIRGIGVLSHALMRYGFGYLRRPVRAVMTLIAAFVLGWWGVHEANMRNMFVIAVEPSADIAAPNSDASYPRGHGATGTPVLMASDYRSDQSSVRTQINCAATISEPLYALDILVPVVDLGEERRCEIRRVRQRGTLVHSPDGKGWGQLIAAVPDLPLNDHRFWWWIKAFYAIAGWILVSLALLTFAQVNRTRGEP